MKCIFNVTQCCQHSYFLWLIPILISYANFETFAGIFHKFDEIVSFFFVFVVVVEEHCDAWFAIILQLFT